MSYAKKKKKERMPWRINILPDHKRNSRLRRQVTETTDDVRQEVDRRSMEILGTDIPCCERCGTPKLLTKAHIIARSALGPGYDPANIINLCGTHGFKGTCHDWADNNFDGRIWKKQYGAMLKLYYAEGNGKNYWSYKEEA